MNKSDLVDIRLWYRSYFILYRSYTIHWYIYWICLGNTIIFHWLHSLVILRNNVRSFGSHLSLFSYIVRSTVLSSGPSRLWFCLSGWLAIAVRILTLSHTIAHNLDIAQHATLFMATPDIFDYVGTRECVGMQFLLSYSILWHGVFLRKPLIIISGLRHVNIWDVFVVQPRHDMTRAGIPHMNLFDRSPSLTKLEIAWMDEIECELLCNQIRQNWESDLLATINVGSFVVVFH